MIESIEKIEVTEMSEVQPLTTEAAKASTYRYGVYMLFYPIEGKDPSSFRARLYCKIGRSLGEDGVGRRIVRNINWHREHRDQCGPVEEHLFQALACEGAIQAARLELLFHLWHGNYPDPNSPVEARHEPLAKMEPDFFYLRSE